LCISVSQRHRNKRPSIFRVDKDSVNKEFVAEMGVNLQERARLRDENEGILEAEKGIIGHLEEASA
jgi:hypothetical protein